MNLAGSKDPPEFTLQKFATLFREDLKNIFPQGFSARQSELAQFTISVPGDNPVITIDCIERQRQRIDDRFGEALLHFGFGGAQVNFTGQGCR